jgi:hypothetical protein
MYSLKKKIRTSFFSGKKGNLTSRASLSFIFRGWEKNSIIFYKKESRFTHEKIERSAKEGIYFSRKE